MSIGVSSGDNFSVQMQISSIVIVLNFVVYQDTVVEIQSKITLISTIVTHIKLNSEELNICP